LHDEFRLRGTEDCERSSGTRKVKQAAAFGWDMVVVVGAEAEEVAKLVIAPTEALGGSEALKAAHASDAAFDAGMILFQAVVIGWPALFPAALG
jgi:hypothetical protein